MLKSKQLENKECFYSFLISTYKPIHSTRAIASINKLNNLLPNNFEILIYTCNEVHDLPNTSFYSTNKDYGSCFGLNHIYNHSKGKYIIIVPDYAEIPDNIADLENFIISNNIEAGTLTACSHVGPHSRFNSPCNSHCRLTDCTILQSFMDKYNNDFNRETLYDVPILFFPVLKRETIENALDGHIFNPFFKHRWVDNWLALFLHRKGYRGMMEFKDFVCHTGVCGRCPGGHTHNAKDDTYDLKIIEWLFANGTAYLDRPDFV